MDNQPVQNPVSESVSTPVQIPEQKPKFPVMFLVLSVFILLFLASTAFLYYQNMQLKNMLANYQNPASSPTPSATADPTANWKTYTNSKYAFSFKYPDSWKIASLNPQDPTILELVARTETGPSESLQYRLFVKSLSKSSDNLPVISGVPDKYPLKFTEEKLGNNIFKVSDQIPSRFGSLGYFIESGNGFVSLEWEPYNAAVDGQFPNQATDVATFKQTISTFKFTQ